MYRPNNEAQGFRLIVVNHAGRLRELFCPIKAQCIQSVPGINHGTWIWIEKLGVGKNIPILYQIHGRWYSYECFAIVINF
jgi:hypothetical protein